MLGTNNEIPTTYESTYSQQHEVAGLQPQRVLCERKNTMIRLALSILLAVAVIGALCIMFPAYNSNTSPSQNTKRKPELSFWPQAFGYLSTTLYDSMELDDIVLNLPWILGAAVTPVFDMVIFYQFYIYK
ncbi:hypothetical protein AX774_g1616 [Zancudomyces culisetae]|uniref:Uncharacterized protein n=1 Tax=Zancudomyces culisetae TaxID=1213189 RepID=A0A1R1PV77_ZANCU|nr:hypothetical protein AX774_g1616 [Zancudomyces culisetae]|eukprot:OMH84851.1 hypothetical protein AX774_g1616 [Zancudomyces culisetae]